MNRLTLCDRAGFSRESGSTTRALNGIARDGTKMGSKHLGAIAMGYVEEVVLDLDGVKEVNYRITELGAEVFLHYLEVAGLPPIRRQSDCVNNRYK